MRRALLAVIAVTVAGGAPTASARTYHLDGPVVMVKDHRGYVGALFRLDHPLPMRSVGGAAGLARLNGVINDRALHKVSRRCYASVLNYKPDWGSIGKSYAFSLDIPDSPSVKRRAKLLRASTGYRINESSGFWKDPKVRRRLAC